jgi:bifunctional UDP-N-acetylglucosamine pyrophosphorylase / glucosamine-1-phosphate N-acetyltransferase
MGSRTGLAIVLAAGEGTRMASRRSKVLHAIGGRSLLGHVLAAIGPAPALSVVVVIGPNQDAVGAEVRQFRPDAQIVCQNERRGTAHAVLVAREALTRGFDDILILFGDTPLIRPTTVARLRDALARGAAVAVLGFHAADPTGYGRLIVKADRLVAIREEQDATLEERGTALCNAGLMALEGRFALDILEQIDCRNAKGEFYLTDAVGIAHDRGLATVALEAAEDEVQGINTRAQLAAAERSLQARLRAAALDGGVTLVAPETVFLSTDTVLGRDVLIEPHVVFGPGVVVEDNVVIRAFSHLEGAHLATGASVGPFARLRAGTRLGANARIGNFVEVKATLVEAGAKANHLAYLGDAWVGAGANIGAGTITCNYDGTAKHRTEIGKGAFVGSNSSLVAPVTIGEGAYIGSGSVITRDVPAHALALGRGEQVVKPSWTQRLASKLSAKQPKGA